MHTSTTHPKVVDVLEAIREDYGLPGPADPAPVPNRWGGVDMKGLEATTVRLSMDDEQLVVLVMTLSGVVLSRATFDWTSSDAVAAFVAFYLH